MLNAEVAIIGGGLAGSSIAYHLAKRGVGCIVLERRGVAAEASGANAGALWPQGELSTPSPYLKLALTSFNRFPALALELRDLTDIDIEFQPSGMLAIIEDQCEVQRIRSALGWRREMGLAFSVMDWDEVHQFEPALSEHIAGGLYFPHEGDVNPMCLNNAFAVGAQRLGATYLTGAEVTHLHLRGSRVMSIETTAGTVGAGTVVIAAGAWAPAVGKMAGLRIPVRPVRGQIMVTEQLPPLFSHCLVAGHTYLVRKARGSVVIGATQEEAGYCKEMTAPGLAGLAAEAVKVVPALASVSVVRSWCGLRPGTDDDWPFLGPAPVVANLVLATGHFRNGCLLSPVTGQVISELIADGRPSMSLHPFRLERFPGWAL